MKMKFPLLFSLLLAPQVIFAQPVQTNKQKTARIASLVEKSASSYLKFKTFSGTIELTLMELNGKEMKPVSVSQMRTIYRLDKAGNKIREVTTLTSRTNIDNKPVSRILKVVDDGKTQTQIAVESKTYARTQRYNEVAPFALLAPALKKIARALRQDDSAVSSFWSLTTDQSLTGMDSRGKKFFDRFYAVIDDESGIIEKLDFSTAKRGIRIRVSSQVFNPHLSESQFKWSPPADFKRITENQLQNSMQGLQAKPKGAKAPEI